MDEISDREKEIFEHALDLVSAEERRRYLESACGNDTVLLARVEALLRADAMGEEFLPEQPKDAGPIISEKPGDKIGRYKLLEQIGEGGFGVVWMAEQEEPVRRRVALKIIKLGMDTRQVIARFEAERQALAMMDHPNIARALDAGATNAGRPYFVMELVRGIRITDYCDQNNLSTTERLGLFVKVSHAIQHAHQKGIVHRDIKPSNVLVTLHDGVPVPKVIDFGIAKATEGRLTDKTLFTSFQQFIGTPAYVSPEQAEMSGLDIDTRSDIYSMGVLLYELLTGQTPFDTSELVSAGLDAIRRTLREVEPPRPSTRLNTMAADALTTTAKHRRTEAPRLVHQIRGDLDWIVMKCLEKDRTRRYATANALAMDLQRHLNDEPVEACPPSRSYRFQKLVRRNKLAFAAASAVLLVLTIGLVVFTRLWQRAEVARANEARLRQKVETRLDIAQARTLFNNKQYDDAEKLLNEIDPGLIVPDAVHASLRRQLGWQRVLQNEWTSAAANLAAVLQVDGTAWDRDVAVDYYHYASVAVKAGDKAGYERFRRALVKRFIGTTDHGGAELVCLLALLTPPDQALLADLSPLYEAASKREEYPVDRAKEERSENYLRRALFDYRRGDYSKADDLIQDCLSPLKDPTILPTALAIRAMIHHQLHLEDEALRELESARLAIEPVIQTGPSAFNARQLSQQGRYYEWLQAGIFLREATALIQGHTETLK